MNRARLRRSGPRIHVRDPDGGGPTVRAAKSRNRRFTSTGSRAVGTCPDPSRTTSSPPVSSAIRLERPIGITRSSVPCSSRTGHRIERSNSSKSAGPGDVMTPPSNVRINISGSPSRPHAIRSSICLVEWGSHRHSEKKNFKEPAVVRAPVVTVVLLPALIVLALGLEVESGLPAGRVGHQRRRDRRRDRACAAHAVRMLGGQHKRAQAAHRQPRHARRLDPRRVEHGHGIGNELAVVIRRRRGRPVGQAVASPVKGHHAEMARQVRDLRLPVARMDDRPRGQEQDRPLARRRTTPRTPGRHPVR